MNDIQNNFIIGKFLCQISIRLDKILKKYIENLCWKFIIKTSNRERTVSRRGGNIMKRVGQVIKVKEEYLEKYKKLHAAPWPEVNEMIKKCNIQNYSIYYRDGYLFSYFEYVGENYEEDMKKMAADPTTRKWWKETDPCQMPVESAKDGEWWADLEEVYHLD